MSLQDFRPYAKWLIEDQCMKLLGMKQSNIAKIMGVSRPTLLAQKNNCYKTITLGQLEAIEKHLGFIKAAILTTEEQEGKV